MKVNFPCKKSRKGVRIRCFTILIFVVALFFSNLPKIIEYTFCPSKRWIEEFNNVYSLNLPYTLDIKYVYSKIDDANRYYVFDCADSEKSFLKDFYEKCQSKILDRFFDEFSTWQDEYITIDGDKIYFYDEFIWSYALNEQPLPVSFNPQTDEYEMSAVVLVYNNIDCMLYCYRYYVGF